MWKSVSVTYSVRMVTKQLSAKQHVLTGPRGETEWRGDACGKSAFLLCF